MAGYHFPEPCTVVQTEAAGLLTPAQRITWRTAQQWQLTQNRIARKSAAKELG